MISWERKVGFRKNPVKIFVGENIVTCVKLSHFSPTLRFYSDNRGIENKQKYAFLLISPNKDSLCLGIQTFFLWNNNCLSINLWSFSNMPPLQAES